MCLILNAAPPGATRRCSSSGIRASVVLLPLLILTSACSRDDPYGEAIYQAIDPTDDMMSAGWRNKITVRHLTENPVTSTSFSPDFQVDQEDLKKAHVTRTSDHFTLMLYTELTEGTYDNITWTALNAFDREDCLAALQSAGLSRRRAQNVETDVTNDLAKNSAGALFHQMLNVTETQLRAAKSATDAVRLGKLLVAKRDMMIKSPWVYELADLDHEMDTAHKDVFVGGASSAAVWIVAFDRSSGSQEWPALVTFKNDNGDWEPRVRFVQELFRLEIKTPTPETANPQIETGLSPGEALSYSLPQPATSAQTRPKDSQ